MTTDVFSALRTLSAAQQRLLRERLGSHPAGDQPQSDDGPQERLTARPRPERIPLSYAQQRLWFLNRFEERDLGYNQIFAVRLTGSLDRAALEAALGDLVERHEILRTVYPEHNGVPQQRILETAAAIPRLEIRRAAANDEEALRQALTDANLPFDLTVEPPLRARLIELGPREHVFHLLLHHIATDWQSDWTLRRELWEAYAARRAGRRPDWAPLPLQYADYALWQRAQLGDDRDPSSPLARQLDYWTSRLAGIPAELPLPFDRPRSAGTGTEGASHRFRLDAGLHRKLTGLASRHDATLFMTLQAAVAELLTRLGAGTDISLSSPTSGRTEAALDGMVGFFINTLVLRTDTSGSPCFAELLARTRATALDAYAHQDLPFERLVDALNPERSPGSHPLTQVMVTLQGTTAEFDALPGLRAERVSTSTGTMHFDLLVACTEHRDAEGRGAGIDVELGFRTGLFDAVTVRGIGARLVRLLTAVAARPDVPLSAIDLLSGAERRQVLTEWQGTPAPAPELSVPALFRAQAARTPGATALSDAERSWTYAELDAWSDQLATTLTSHGARAEDRLALLMERTPATIATVLAILKTGAAYLPLRTTDPTDRHHQIIAQAQPRLLLTDPATTGPAMGLPEVTIAPEPPGGEAAFTLPAIHPEQLAYVMFTSGSTGRPKGVAITHRNIADLTTDQRWTDGSHSCVLLHSPLAFDASTYELWTPLLTGGHVHLAPPGELSLTALAHTLRHGPVTAAFLTSGLFQLLADLDPQAFTGLQEIWAGGDIVPALSVQRVHQHCPTTTVVNVYGPTETTTFATSNPVRRTTPGSSRVPIGAPLDNMRAYILDRHLRPCPPGQPGELYLAGQALARGYLNHPHLTAERFVASPYGAPGDRLYHTGDLARWSPHGQIDFLGRNDNQVKIRGFRIEPDEIQSVITSHPAIRHSAVTIHEDHPGTKQLIAYLVPEDPHHFSLDGLRHHLTRHLPAYMHPSAYLTLDTLPLNSNGKIDHRALPAPPRPGGHAGDGAEPATPGEKKLCDLFAEVFGAETVGAAQDFFAAGGNSLLVMRLCSLIRKEFGHDLTAREVFAHPTPRALAALLDERTGPDLSRPPLRPGTAAGHQQVLAPVQQGLWFLHQLDGYRAAYNVPLALRLSGPLDRPALTEALHDLTTRHAALRTTIPDDDGEPVPRAVPAGELPALPGLVTTTEEHLPGLLEEHNTREFDLETEIPLHARLFRLNATEHVLSLVIHHLAIDGWSTQILWTDLATAYHARTRRQRPGWRPLPLHYADYAHWQHTLLGTTDHPTPLATRQLHHWRTTLDRLPAELPLPYDHPRPTDDGRTAHELVITWEPAVLNQLESLATEAGTTLLTVAQAAVAGLLTRLGAGTDIPLGTPVAGRHDEELNGVVGYFVNTLTLRLDTSGEPDVRTLVDRARETALTAYAHQDLPFDRLVLELRPERAANRNPLFQTSVTCGLADTGPPSFGETTATALPTVLNTAKFDLSFAFTDDRGGPSGGLRCRLSYCAELFEATTALRIRDELDCVIREFAAAQSPRAEPASTRPAHRVTSD
jgi:amino acid adenylation domain-containing protein